MAVTSMEITAPHLLVVEGEEDAMFFGALLRYLGLPNVQIMPIGGKTQLRQNLNALVRSPVFPDVVSLGVVRDANADPRSSFQSVRDALLAVALSAPDRPLLPVGQQPRVSVLILPDEHTSGALEDLCLRAVLPDPAMLCVEQYFGCLQQQGLLLPHNASKARAQVFLASRPEAESRLGMAGQKGYWPWQDQAFGHVRDFLRQLAA
jgi:hypothetical protein